MRKSFLIVCLVLVSLVGDAQISLPDSMLTITKSYACNITSPDTAQAILRTIRERQTEPAWRVDFAEGDLNYNMRRYLKALSYFERVKAEPSLRDSSYLQLLLYKRLMDCYDELYLHDDLVRTIYNLRKMARARGDRAFESMAVFKSGKQHHYHGHIDLGYASCLEGLEIMREAEYVNKHIELRNYYAELLKMYTRDGRYEDAIHMSRYQEAEALYPSPAIMRKARERGLRQVYALRASMYAHAGDMAEANKAYAAWKKTTCGNAIDDMDIFDYLQLSHHNDEALSTIVHYREFISEQGDTISYRMLSALNREALFRMDMGDYEQAAACGRQVAVIAHKLHIIKSGEQMQTTYRLLKEESSSQQKSQWLTVMIVILVAILVLALVILYYVRYIRRRNVELVKVLNSLDAYRRAVLNGDALTSPKVVAAVETMRTVELSNAGSSHGVDAPDDEDRRLYIEMDTQVTRDRLFLKPGLGREDLMRLIGVDKNRFGKMMGKYSDASNTSVYISRKRVEYGAKLLLEQPDYTIATVATECGMSNTVTFNRIFKDTYKMTPSEYREKMGAALRANQQ
ncbi:MAG: helix-turn-helix domain-containing protein [Prevotella sp.]|nr:helix-turn-helix domain-containing protein [Prevotella sp.]